MGREKLQCHGAVELGVLGLVDNTHSPLPKLLKYQAKAAPEIWQEVDNPMSLRTVRRKVARLNTIIHEFDTGIRKRQG